MSLDELLDEFAAQPDAEARSDLLIDLGLDLPRLLDEHKTEAHRIHGCQSNAWLVVEVSSQDPPVIDFAAESEAVFINGVIMVLMTAYSGKTARDVLALDIESILGRIGLDQTAVSSRHSGIGEIVRKVRSAAASAGGP